MGSAFAQEQLLLNIQEDAWAVLRMTGYQVLRENDRGHHGLVVELYDENHLGVFYTLDNGHDASPDGHGLRVRYTGLSGPEIFTRYNLPGDMLSWQQKAVEPALVAIRDHRSGLDLPTTDIECESQMDSPHTNRKELSVGNERRDAE
jgi:hypothetical protein